MLLLGGSAWADLPEIDTTRARNLDSWKPQIAEYSLRHYGVKEWRLDPTCIVLHYTAGKSFPTNLVESTEFAEEQPGVAAHFVVDEGKIWEILPTNVRCRAAFGINHKAISIEMVGADASDLMENRKATMDTCAELVVALLRQHGLRPESVYSHQQVATMDRNIVPGVLDLTNSNPYHKIDPGEQPMDYIMQAVRRRIGSNLLN